MELATVTTQGKGDVCHGQRETREGSPEDAGEHAGRGGAGAVREAGVEPDRDCDLETEERAEGSGAPGPPVGPSDDGGRSPRVTASSKMRWDLLHLGDIGGGLFSRQQRTARPGQALTG
ncbi:hypothetical protein GCM10009710_33390 [Aeromicrobium alkaliterrae]|uniref:Uncharacterized protein n=1 Tax=Aeromicrobium alkaliterrae TaxID=302168 RepID=A0ABN2K923_9ACTN